MKKTHNYFLLFSNCIPVKGAQRSIICDLQLNRYRFIPTLLYDILQLTRNKKVTEIKKIYNNQYNKGIDEFFKLLIDEEWGFSTNTPEHLPELDLKWETSSEITNFIIDINKDSDFNYKEIISQLNELRCEALQVRSYEIINTEIIIKIAELTSGSTMHNIEFILKYYSELTNDFFEKIIRKNKRIRNIYLHTAIEEKKEALPNNLGNIYYSIQKIESESHCGIIHSGFFSSNIELFTESQHYNNCLNKKLSIDINGDIKICPSLKKSYGNINDTPLKSLINNDEIKKMWGIDKSQIDVCKDCEFRYICTDCRAFLTDENILSKPIKCNYDPYTAQWKN